LAVCAQRSLGPFSFGPSRPQPPTTSSRLEALAANPHQKGDFEANDDTGRSIQVKVVGAFLVSFWADAFVKELRIINIEWV